MAIAEELRRRLAAAYAEARRVGDSPLRADALAAVLVELRAAVGGEAGATEEIRNRIVGELNDAERVLRRDDDGPEAARHLQAALRWAEDRPRSRSPFLDD